ncbi:hypothetical protein BV378_37915 [Nostoc sp. RF31YmG]|nr:hypothetical protein BV378_37915 [Nostoc sp. RF31YmG]
MFGFKSKLINATLAASVAIPLATAGTFTSAGSAQAATLNGSIGLSGTATIPSDGVNPLSTFIKFEDVDGVNTTGDFASFLPTLEPNPSVPQITINTLNLTRKSVVNPITATYSTGDVSPFINFGLRTLGSTTALLTFDLDNSEVTRIGLSNSNIADLTLSGITGKFNFNGQSIATGFLNASLSGASSTYQLTIVSTPEPTTMLGLALVGAGMAMSRRRKTQVSS